MSGEPPDEFPVERPEPEPDTKKKRSAAWTPEKRAAFGEKMQRLKAAKREERERTGVTGSTSRAGTKRSRSSPKVSAPSSQLEEIETSLVEGLTKFGGAITPIAPIPGVYTIQTAEDFAGALTRLAAKNPALLKALSGSSTVMDYVAVGVWGMGMFVAINVQMGRIPADSRAAQNYGLTDIAREIYPEQPVQRIDVEPVSDGRGAFDPFTVPVPPDVAEAQARARV